MSVTLRNIIKCLNESFNEKIQQEWDNSGLVYGTPEQNVDKIIVCLDICEDVILRAIENKVNLIISHHPLIFKPIYSLANDSYKKNLLLQAIKNDIGIYCIHTPADKAVCGLNYANAEILGLKNIKPVLCDDDYLYSVEFISQEKDICKITKLLHEFGFCNIFIIHDIYNKLAIKANITAEYLNTGLKNIKNSFNTEAINIYETKTKRKDICSFVIGEINEMNCNEFVCHVKKTFNLAHINVGGYLNNKINKVAICSGSGRSFLNKVIFHKADAYITGDLAHHDFQDAFENKLMLLDATHYETEKIFLDIISNIIINKNIGIREDNIITVDQRDYFCKIL